ncbi:AAA domain-containing protein [Phaeosphaeria sp. MPI-PUGE-AT-0046c]|nr:AAA domain-containing protein [Phaeosphaeria sp. MPI-PUGE-AT-0046c]
MSNVYIIGAQSTGKTTLVNALEAQLETERNANDCIGLQRPSVIREVARTVLKEKKYSREDITASPTRALQLQKDILQAQYEAETVANVENTTSWYMCDRSGLDPVVYTACFVGDEAAAEMLESRIWLELESRMRKGVVILCEAGGQWLIDDGVRLMPTDSREWTRIDTTFRTLLDTRCIAYSILSHDLVDLSKRVEYVRSIIEGSARVN